MSRFNCKQQSESESPIRCVCMRIFTWNWAFLCTQYCSKLGLWTVGKIQFTPVTWIAQTARQLPSSYNNQDFTLFSLGSEVLWSIRDLRYSECSQARNQQCRAKAILCVCIGAVKALTEVYLWLAKTAAKQTPQLPLCGRPYNHEI